MVLWGLCTRLVRTGVYWSCEDCCVLVLWGLGCTGLVRTGVYWSCEDWVYWFCEDWGVLVLWGLWCTGLVRTECTGLVRTGCTGLVRTGCTGLVKTEVYWSCEGLGCTGPVRTGVYWSCEGLGCTGPVRTGVYWSCKDLGVLVLWGLGLVVWSCEDQSGSQKQCFYFICVIKVNSCVCAVIGCLSCCQGGVCVLLLGDLNNRLLTSLQVLHCEAVPWLGNIWVSECLWGVSVSTVCIMCICGCDSLCCCLCLSVSGIIYPESADSLKRPDIWVSSI